MSLKAALSAATFGAVVALVAGQASAVEIAISCGVVGAELDTCKRGVAAWEKATGNKGKIVTTPNESNSRLAMYQQLLAGGSGDIDVFHIDVVWPLILANHFIDLKPYSKGAESEHFPALVENDTIQRQVGGHALVHRRGSALLPQGSA